MASDEAGVPGIVEDPTSNHKWRLDRRIVTVSEDVTGDVDRIVSTMPSIRKGQVVPESKDIALLSGAVELDATYLYADLAGSSKAAQTFYAHVTGRIIRQYLSAASRLIRWQKGEIRSFDGDRVMGIFIGDSKNTSAVRSALAINWAVSQVIRPRLKQQWDTIEDSYVIGHGVGIATGTALLMRGGVRGDNDIVSIGEAPNVAAKLSEIRRSSPILITRGVYDGMNSSVKMNGTTNMWSSAGRVDVGGSSFDLVESRWYWSP